MARRRGPLFRQVSNGSWQERDPFRGWRFVSPERVALYDKKLRARLRHKKATRLVKSFRQIEDPNLRRSATLKAKWSRLRAIAKRENIPWTVEGIREARGLARITFSARIATRESIVVRNLHRPVWEPGIGWTHGKTGKRITGPLRKRIDKAFRETHGRAPEKRTDLGAWRGVRGEEIPMSSVRKRQSLARYWETVESIKIYHGVSTKTARKLIRYLYHGDHRAALDDLRELDPSQY